MSDLTNQYGDMTRWKIESRQRSVLGFGGHNYLALIDNNGNVVEELHGWVTGGFFWWEIRFYTL